MIVLLRSLTAALALAVCLAPSAFADTRLANGTSLVLSETLSNDTTINVDNRLSGQIRVTMHDASCLAIVEGNPLTVSTSGCSGNAGRLTIDVPSSTPLIISNSGSGDLRFADTIAAPVTLSLSGSGDVVGRDIMGPLVLAVHGSNDVSLGTVSGDATFEMSSNGDVRLTGLTGPLVLKHSGSGDLAVGHIDSPSVTIDSTGSGDMLFGRGTIRTIVAHLQGNGDLGVAAEVHDGDVRAYGGGDVKLGRVTGTLNKANGDNSDIYVGGPEIVDTVVGQLAKSIASAESHSNVAVNHRLSGGTHFLMIVVLAIAAFIAWRMMRRPGGLQGFRRSAAPAAPTHPGVLAVAEKMARMEERLGRVESYVTSREFDLHQKFRNL